MALLLFLLAASAVSSLASVVSYEGYSLYRIYPSEPEHLTAIEDFLRQSRERYETKQIDVWKGPVKVNRSVDLLLSPTIQPDFAAAFAAINYTRPIPNIQKQIDEEAQDKAGEEQQSLLERLFGWGKIHEYMRDLAKRNPHIVQLTTIGEGVEGNELLVMQVASSVGSITDKPSVWIDGGIHAREWVSPSTVLYFITQLVKGYDNGDREIKNLVDSMAWYFLPVTNPDGYKYSFERDRLWRKNKRPNNQRFVLQHPQ